MESKSGDGSSSGGIGDGIGDGGSSGSGTSGSGASGSGVSGASGSGASGSGASGASGSGGDRSRQRAVPTCTDDISPATLRNMMNAMKQVARHRENQRILADIGTHHPLRRRSLFASPLADITLFGGHTIIGGQLQRQSDDGSNRSGGWSSDTDGEECGSEREASGKNVGGEEGDSVGRGKGDDDRGIGGGAKGDQASGGVSNSGQRKAERDESVGRDETEAMLREEHIGINDDNPREKPAAQRFVKTQSPDTPENLSAANQIGIEPQEELNNLSNTEEDTLFAEKPGFELAGACLREEQQIVPPKILLPPRPYMDGMDPQKPVALENSYEAEEEKTGHAGESEKDEVCIPGNLSDEHASIVPPKIILPKRRHFPFGIAPVRSLGASRMSPANQKKLSQNISQPHKERQTRFQVRGDMTKHQHVDYPVKLSVDTPNCVHRKGAGRAIVPPNLQPQRHAIAPKLHGANLCGSSNSTMRRTAPPDTRDGMIHAAQQHSNFPLGIGGGNTGGRNMKYGYLQHPAQHVVKNAASDAQENLQQNAYNVTQTSAQRRIGTATSAVPGYFPSPLAIGDTTNQVVAATATTMGTNIGHGNDGGQNLYQRQQLMMQNANGPHVLGTGIGSGCCGHPQVSTAGSQVLLAQLLPPGIDSGTSVREASLSSVGVAASGGQDIGPFANQRQQQHLTTQTVIGPHGTRVGIGCRQLPDGSRFIIASSLPVGINAATGIRSVHPSSTGVAASGGHGIVLSDNQQQHYVCGPLCGTPAQSVSSQYHGGPLCGGPSTGSHAQSVGNAPGMQMNTMYFGGKQVGGPYASAHPFASPQPFEACIGPAPIHGGVHRMMLPGGSPASSARFHSTEGLSRYQHVPVITRTGGQVVHGHQPSPLLHPQRNKAPPITGPDGDAVTLAPGPKATARHYMKAIAEATENTQAK